MRTEWLAVVFLAGTAWAGPPEESASEADPEASDPAAVAAGQAAFVQVASVLQSPRCMNCHPAGDAPLQGDASRPHDMSVMRDNAGVGVPCTTCHRPVGYDAPHLPPGNPVWHLAPRTQVFEGLSPGELCASLKDTERNGGRDLHALLEHVSDDPLVRWGWTPGGGRTTPPLDHPAFVAAFTTWVDAGGPCP